MIENDAGAEKIIINPDKMRQLWVQDHSDSLLPQSKSFFLFNTHIINTQGLAQSMRRLTLVLVWQLCDHCDKPSGCSAFHSICSSIPWSAPTPATEKHAKDCVCVCVFVISCQTPTFDFITRYTGPIIVHLIENTQCLLQGLTVQEFHSHLRLKIDMGKLYIWLFRST